MSPRPTPSTARPTARRARAGALALTAALATGAVLAGCSDPVPTPGAAAAPTTGADLTVDQETAVLGKIGSVLDVADRKRDPKALESRLTGPALAMRTSELTVAKVKKSDADVTDLPTQVQAIVVPSTPGWPRAALAVSSPPQSDEPPRLMVMRQAGARDDYQLWGWVRLFPGTTMPKFATAEQGAENLASDDTSLLWAPRTVVTRYLDVVQKGSKSKYADQFGSDAYRSTVAAAAKSWTSNADFKKADGSYSMSLSAGKWLVASRTEDGGAVVFAGVTQKEKIAAEKGAKITAPNSTQRALMGKDSPTNELDVVYRVVVAVHVPAKGATGAAAKPTVLGVEQVPVSVSAG
ncbi:hypothetical protein [Luteimicrobium subarcticum]|uniref:DUF8094 domain-containing protein n=1 Tax=Luteimicrobium subarcticum TaxID=620910 RepID=A0A2M8W1F3_9MICO|nr:hypothetical protein [Luteimicrobium subarcticum]PJI84764.1 hypothetical protein CLV34_3220 [Luteimicrobium subarcticum]